MMHWAQLNQICVVASCFSFRLHMHSVVLVVFILAQDGSLLWGTLFFGVKEINHRHLKFAH